MKISAPRRLAGLFGMRIIGIVQDQEVVKTILKYLGFGLMQLKTPIHLPPKIASPALGF
jgi:hypothetical protein